VSNKIHRILVINPGSTSTKVAVYEDKKEINIKTLEHTAEEIAKYKEINEQLSMRKEAVLDYLKEMNIEQDSLSAIAARGGVPAILKGGAYLVNEALVEASKNPLIPHASSLGAVVAYEIANPLGIPSYIYDAVSVDEMDEIARISGMPDIDRDPFTHALNSRAVSIKTAESIGKKYKDANMIVAHLGGGISTTLHSGGRIIDLVSDDEGTFSPERSGRVPCRKLIDLCYSGKHDKKTMRKKLRGKGGLVAYLDTNSAVEVEEKINNGDEYAKLIYSAMAYQIAKDISSLASIVKGNVDRVIITGGIAHSKMMTGWIKERVEFIAPVEIVAGTYEMEALAYGALRVLNGEEDAHIFE